MTNICCKGQNHGHRTRSTRLRSRSGRDPSRHVGTCQAILQEGSLEYSATYDKNSFLLAFYPLDDLVCALGETRTRGVGACNAVEFEEGCYPGERDAVMTNAMEDFEM
jgi:hypothetical protein